MKTGRSLTDLAVEIERQKDAKKDALVVSQSIRLNTNGRSLMWLGGDEPFTMQPLAHRQLGLHLGVPVKWYDAMRDQVEAWRTPDGQPLFDTTMNTLLAARPVSERRLVRTLDGNARAFLSDRYRTIDHAPILEAILPVLMEMPGIVWEDASLEVTDQRLYLKIVNERLRADVKVGDTVQAGVLITNSEVGLGAFRVQPLLYRLVCSNGMVVQDAASSRSKFHVGGVMGDSEDGQAYAWLSDETLAARSSATVLEMRDVVRGALNDVVFQRTVDAARAAAEVKVEGDPVKSVEWITDKFGLDKDEQAGVLRSLIAGGDLSLWGLVNSVTATAQGVQSYDRSTDIESFGGRLLALPRHEITALVTAN